MESLPQLKHHHHQPLHIFLNRHRPSLPKPISPLSFPTPPLHPPSSPFNFKPIRASTSSSPSFTDPLPQTHKPSPFQSLNPLASSFLRTTCIAIASAALIFTRLPQKPAFAAPVISPTVDPIKESAEEEASFDEQERALEEHLLKHPNDVQALKSLMEIRVQARKIGPALETIDRLIELQPEEIEWPLLKYHLYTFTGELESARQGFEELLKKDSLLIQPYLGLVALASEKDDSLKELGKRIDEAMERCKKERTKSDVRDFKLLIAQLKVIEKNYNDALKMYEELVREEPKDFRPYLCQGIIYTLLKKNDEAEKQFEKYRRLVPKNHPYAEYFDDNVTATKVFSKKFNG